MAKRAEGREMKPRNIGVDIDGTLTKETEGWGYAQRTPDKNVIEKINMLFDLGHNIILHSSRFQDDLATTKKWLKLHGVKYSAIILGKPRFDFYIGDEVIPPDDLAINDQGEPCRFSKIKAIRMEG